MDIDTLTGLVARALTAPAVGVASLEGTMCGTPGTVCPPTYDGVARRRERPSQRRRAE